VHYYSIQKKDLENSAITLCHRFKARRGVSVADALRLWQARALARCTLPCSSSCCPR